MSGQELPGRTEQGEFLGKVLAQLEDYVYVWNRQGQFVYANERLERLWGLRHGDYAGKTPEELHFSSANVRLFRERLEEVLRTRQAVQDRFTLPAQDGRERQFEYVLTPILDANGEVELVAGVSRDLGARREAEAALLESERQFQLLFDSIDQAFCLLEVEYDDDGNCRDFRLLKANPAFTRHTGLSDALGARQSELLPELEDKWMQAWCRVARTGLPERFIEKSPALGRWYDASIFPVGEAGTDRVALLFYDITDRKEIEQALQDADRRKDDFLATLAHELRNPLAAIRTSVDLVKLARNEPTLVQEAFETIERQSRQLSVLVDDLLEVSRISRGKLELRKARVPLAEVVQIAVECSQPLIREAGHTLILNLPQEPIYLDADPHRLSQVLANLLNNAAKFTPDRGRIRLSARAEGSELQITVQDSGIGIAPELQEHVFELFAQVDRSQEKGNMGLGLGLTLARSLVEMHGGSIGVQSGGLGQGSTFTVCLPLGEQRREPRPPAVEGLPAIDGGHRVLVVDDNHAAARMLAMVLRMLGNEAWTAGDGEEALTFARELRPDVIFMDLGMPKLDGYEAVRHIRAQPWGQHIVIAALSGWGQDEDRVRTREAGFDCHLVKPAGKADLVRVLGMVHARQLWLPSTGTSSWSTPSAKDPGRGGG